MNFIRNFVSDILCTANIVLRNIWIHHWIFSVLRRHLFTQVYRHLHGKGVSSKSEGSCLCESMTLRMRCNYPN
jgi:hypothetical protein